MDLSRTLAGIKLEHPLMNAAGTAKTLDDVKKVAKTAASAVVLGSITLDPRGGNLGNTYFVEDHYALNSLGMPNPGLVATVAKMEEMVAVTHGAGKPLIVSVAGFSPEEYGILADTMFEHKADMVELNLGCPNVWQTKGKIALSPEQKPIASFYPELMGQIFNNVVGRVGPRVALSVKLSPCSNPEYLKEVAAFLKEFPIVKAIVCCNTFPNAFAFLEGRPAITAANGFGGLSGHPMKPIALGQLRQFRQEFSGQDEMDFVGAGGVWSGGDLQDHLWTGAKAVQVATAFLERGGKVFSDILTEYVQLSESR